MDKSNLKHPVGGGVWQDKNYNAKISQWSQDDRATLAAALPLIAPLSIQFEPSGMFNFKCSYCLRQDAGYTAKAGIIPLKTFKKFVDDIARFKKPIKTIMFARLGEPTLNKELPEMIAYATQSRYVEQTKVITNGSTLNPKLNKALANAGLDVLRISLQGLEKEEYINTCQYNMNIDKLVESIADFYNNRGNCKLFLKILDTQIQGREDLFFDKFANICDEIAIEHQVDMSPNNTKDIRQNTITNMMQENIKADVLVCPMPFYALHINSLGDVTVCGMDAVKLGNIDKDSIVDIWNESTMLKEFRLMQLQGKRYEHKICRTCTLPATFLQKCDQIDDVREKLVAYY